MRRLIGTVTVTVTVVLLAGSAFAAEKKLSRDMELMDANRDGRVTAEEHADGAKKMFEMMDADKDGLVTAAEMTAAQDEIHGDRPRRGAPSSEEKIAVIDADRDGKVSAAEHEEASQFMFEKMDADKDGFLAQREIDQGHSKLMKKQARGRQHKRP